MRSIWLLLDSRGMGGIESHVAELAAGLAAAGEQPLVIFLADHGPHPLKDRLSQHGLAWTALTGGWTELRRRLSASRPGVLHTHGYKANILGRLAAWLAGVPTVASYHAGERPGGKLAVYDAVDRYTSLMGGRIAVSKAILDRLPYGGRLIPNFVTVPAQAPGRHPSSIGFVGRMVADKGPDQFCELAHALPQAAFIAFGDGPMRAALQDRAGSRVRFVGAVPGMDAAWAEIGLLAITSRAEGLPLAALEAMAHGVPVAAFALGGLPELITHGRTGYLAAPGDVTALANAVRDWLDLDGDKRLAMATAAWTTVRDRFSRAAGVAQVQAAYQSAIGR